MTDAPTDSPALDGMIPAALAARTRTIFLNDYDLPVDIGFHEYEIGRPQRLLISVEIWLDEAAFADSDDADGAWNYDHLRTDIRRVATERRYNLQETLARALYAMIASRHGVVGLTVSTRKPDIYADCAAVGVSLSSR